LAVRDQHAGRGLAPASARPYGPRRFDRCCSHRARAG